MTMKTTTSFLALAGACVLALTGPVSLAVPPTPTPPGPAPDVAASSLPVGDVDTALTSKSGETTVPEPSDGRKDPTAIVGVIVQLQDGAERDAALASINEAVAAVFPGESAHVQREYDKALQGFALSAPAGSLDAIRAVPGVKGAFVERETQVNENAAADAEGGFAASRLSDQDPDNLSAQIMMRTDQVSQKGEGKVIAVIDTGVDVSHPAFAGALASAPSMTAEAVAALTPQLGEGKSGVYVNEKFPFAYDYAENDADVSPSVSHGTHVAGIAAGNADQIVGVAPEAQIVVAKVSRDGSRAISDSALLAALDDMVLLRPDVINLSLGWTAGMDNEADSVYATVYKKLQEAGITVDAASGNAFSAGYGNTSGRNLPYASDPDSSVLAEPASYSSVVAVASLNNRLTLNVLKVAGRDIAYQRARGANGEKIAELTELNPGDYEYVDAGFASEEDVAALAAKYPDGLAGKFVLVSRGELTYSAKIDNIAPLKPAGILIYNNVPGEELLVMSLTTSSVPAAFISLESGQAMLEAADHHLTLVDGKTITPNSNYSMSDFSAWGVSPDLRLKPEVSAPGGDVYSAVPGGTYEFMSGTSMASPQMAGISAIVLQRVQSDPLFASMSAREKVEVVQNLIMGTARPLTDAAQTSGVLYSPRKQGAGLVDALAATTSSVYPTVVGAPEQSRPKADLGDGTRGWHFDVTLHNLSGVEATYELSSQALSEIVEGGFFTEHSSDWRGRGVDISYSGKTVSGTGEGVTVNVPANGEAMIGVDVTPGADFASYVAQNAPNGTFLDGFVRFASKTGGQPDLAVPYLGFYGDWGKAPIFDALASDGGEHARASAIYNGMSNQPLGYNPMMKAEDRVGNPRADRYVLSRSEASGAPSVLDPRTGTLRSVHRLNTVYSNAAGETIESLVTHQAWKSNAEGTRGVMSWVELWHDPTYLYTRTEPYEDLPDGMYRLTISAHNDGPSQVEQSISYDFRLDTVGPVVSHLTYVGEGEDTVVSFDVSDSSPLAGIDLHDPADGSWFYRHVFTDAEGTVGADGTYTYHVEVPFKDIDAAWGHQGGSGSVIAHPYLLAWDYGLNHSEAATLDLPSENPGACLKPDGGHWVKDVAGWWYACADGAGYLKDGWFTINGRDYLFNPSGYMLTGFLKRADGQWVYANESGALVGGWVRDGGSWYYLDPATKVMKTGWVADGGSWYYLRASGAMATGWVADGGSWYYLRASGVMATGWVQVDGSWYYLSDSGKMTTGWVNVGGSWYYLNASGVMLTGTQVINGRTYVFDDSGAWMR